MKREVLVTTMSDHLVYAVSEALTTVTLTGLADLALQYGGLMVRTIDGEHLWIPYHNIAHLLATSTEVTND